MKHWHSGAVTHLVDKSIHSMHGKPLKLKTAVAMDLTPFLRWEGVAVKLFWLVGVRNKSPRGARWPYIMKSVVKFEESVFSFISFFLSFYIYVCCFFTASTPTLS